MHELKKIWYDKLKDSGFVDIETNHPKEYLKAWHAHYFQCRYTEVEFSLKQEYFRKASIFFWDYDFESHTEQEIWRLHAEGFSLRDISELLKSGGIKMNKDTVNKTILRLTAIMLSMPEENDE